MQPSPDAIRALAELIAHELTAPQPSPAAGVQLGDGVFSTVDEAVQSARVAFHAFSAIGLTRRKKIISALRDALRPHAQTLAQRALDETGLGRLEHKVQKNLLVIEKTPGPEALEPAARSGDDGLVLFEPAPFGVFGAITPCTNPTSTIICNAIGMLSAGNTVVFNVHPSAQSVSRWTVQLINRAIVSAGGPPNTLTCIAVPTLKSAAELMHHPNVRILAVTGGGGVVKAAMNSGKRAICAGPGNPPTVVDATANIQKAAKDIVYGHSFDNNIICVDEKEVIALAEIADALKAAMVQHGAYLLPPELLPKLEQTIFTKNAGPRGHAVVNRDFVGKDASVILNAMGLPGGPEVKTILVEVHADHPLMWTEQMMPVLPLTRVNTVDAAIELAVAVEGGCFHTASMHSHDIAALSKMARASNASIFVKNGSHVAGLGHGGEGYTSFTIASPTGEGLTGPREFSRWRRCTIVEHFRIV